MKRFGKKFRAGKEPAIPSSPPAGAPQGHPPQPGNPAQYPAAPWQGRAASVPPRAPVQNAAPAPQPQQAAAPQAQTTPPPQQAAAPSPPPPPRPPQSAPPPQRSAPPYPAGGGGEKSLGEIVSEVSEKGALLVREEIELAKAEMVEKARTLARGAGIGIAAAVFLSFAAVMLLHTIAWFVIDLFDLSAIWIGFGVVTLLLVVLAIIAGLLARKWLGTGPPTPNLAIQEAKTTRQTLEHHQQQPPWRTTA